MRNTMDLTRGSVTKTLWVFTIPIIISNLLQQLYNAADVIVVGQFAGKLALAAVGSTAAPTTMMVNLFVGLSIGTNVICANLRGARDQAGLDRCMHTAIALAALGGLAMTVVGELISRKLLIWMSTPENVLELAVLYVRIFFLGFPASLVYNFGAGILRAYGDTRRPMVILMLSGIINVGLNLLFVITFHMSVAGVALATVISQIFSAVAVMALLLDPKGEFRLRLKAMRFHKNALLQILRVGIPCGLNSMVFSISNVIIQSTVNPFGDTVIAGNTAANSISAFVYQVLNAFHNACVSFSGQCYGAKEYRRIDKLFASSLLSCDLLILLLAVLMTVFPRPMISLYNTDPEVIDAAIPRLLIISWGYLIYTVSELALGCLRGIGKTTIPTVLNIVGICAPRILWCMYVVPLAPGHSIIYWCFPVSWIISAAMMVIYYLVARRKLQDPAVQTA